MENNADDGDQFEILPTKEDILFEKYQKFGGIRFKMIIADATIYPGIIIYLYNRTHEILRQFIIHYKDCADFVPIHTLDKEAKGENVDIKQKFFEFLGSCVHFRNGRFYLKGIKSYKSMKEFIRERQMHLDLKSNGTTVDGQDPDFAQETSTKKQ